MNTGTYAFKQILDTVPRKPFARIVNEYSGERYTKTLSAGDHFRALVFGQLSARESVRDIVSCLSAHKTKLYHLGFNTEVKRSTLARANEKRDWRIWRDLALVLIERTRKLYDGEPRLAEDITSACYAIDATSIEVCLSLFPKFPFVPTKGAVRLHLGLDIQGSIPAFFDITSGKVHEVRTLDTFCYEPGAFYVLDRGYLDFGRLYRIHQSGAFFVIRAKTNTSLKRRYSRTVDRDTSVLCDQIVTCSGVKSKHMYPDTLRRIKYKDAEGHVYVFLTNNKIVSSTSVALLYKNRWQIELFFKWIKQHLRIKRFWGHTENAVKTHICIALCAYLLVAILKKTLKLERNLYEILQILQVSLFERNGLVELFSGDERDEKSDGDENTLNLFGF